MRSTCLLPITLATVALCSFELPGQSQSILFTGRFPFVSLSSPNERLGGSASRLEEFDFSYVTPGAGAAARSLLPATAMQCYLGDGDNNGNYTKFRGLKTYFEALQIGGLFVKARDKATVDAHKVFFTVRDNVTANIEVFTNNGTAVSVLRPGDWVRLLPNGNVEFFMTADQLDVAAGPPNTGGTSVRGAHALLQTAGGDLYYVPVQGGHWVNGNGPTPVFANDGAIVKIDAASITYDGNGNIASFAPNSARLILEEVNVGPSANPVSVRTMVVASGAQNRDGTPVVAAGIYGKTVGIDLDPNGGTFTSAYPDSANNFTQEPNLVFASDAGSYAGTIFSTASNGSVAVINGVTCGSVSPGVPATGSWLGVQFDYANFQPSLMSLVLVPALRYEPLVLDMPDFGAVTTTQATIDIDVQAQPNQFVFVLGEVGPAAPGGFPLSTPISLFPPVFSADSYRDLFVGPNSASIGFAVCNFAGFGTVSLINFHGGRFTNATIVLQAAGIGNGNFQTSNPVMLQLK